MKLSFSEIKQITFGAERVFEKDGALSFSRFTEDEESVYSSSPARTLRAISTPGIRLWFKTDATSLRLGVRVREKARPYFSTEVFSDDEFIGEIKNYPDNLPNGKYPGEEFPIGDYEKNFNLGHGEKCVKIILPGTVKLELSYLELIDASYVTPVTFEKKAIIYGDSITQGFDSLSPSRVYSVRLCDYLKAEGINKAVGGAVYDPALVEAGMMRDADFVFGAYGINDWMIGVDKETFTDNCRRFWKLICEKYPDARKVLITPIWAGIWDQEKALGKANNVHQIITDAVAGLPGIEIINGWNLVPHDKNLYGDENVHPNSKGFDEFFKNLTAQL